jgi:hypothetical protein
MASDLELYPNIGAEEPDWRSFAGQHAVRTLGQLWSQLFEPEPVFDWLPASGSVAWLNTDEAAAAVSAGPLFGAAPNVVRRVHDKAFAQQVAKQAGLQPADLGDAICVFEPEELADSTQVLREIDAHIGRWPDWLGGRFTLKPRHGTSGRGRVSAHRDVPGALARLVAQGGAILEPWLERVGDLSTQLYLAPDGQITIVGTTELRVTRSGVYLGQRGTVDSRGRVASGSVHEPALREAAVAVAREAAAEGFWGPCGLDSLTFRGSDGREVLRPVVEFNARFTAGTVALGLIRRALPQIRASLGLPPDAPRAFAFALSPPRGGWPRSEGGLQLIPLAPAVGADGPALLVGRDGEELRSALGD